MPDKHCFKHQKAKDVIMIKRYSLIHFWRPRLWWKAFSGTFDASHPHPALPILKPRRTSSSGNGGRPSCSGSGTWRTTQTRKNCARNTNPKWRLGGSITFKSWDSWMVSCTIRIVQAHPHVSTRFWETNNVLYETLPWDWLLAVVVNSLHVRDVHPVGWGKVHEHWWPH